MTAGKGWAWGTTDGGEWLCIPGSYRYGPRLAATQAEVVPYPENIVNTTPVLALVEDVGQPSRIVEVA